MPLGSGDTWDETNPQQSTLANTEDSYNRDLRIGVRGRLAQEHEWPSSQSVTSAAGMHKFISLQNQTVKPTISGTQLAAIYSKTVGSGLQEMFWENEAGTEVQLTSRSSAVGNTIQSIWTSDSTIQTVTSTIPFDNTTPLWSEGTEYSQIATTILPSSVSNYFEIEVNLWMIKRAVQDDTTGFPIASIFTDVSGVQTCVGVMYAHTLMPSIANWGGNNINNSSSTPVYTKILVAIGSTNSTVIRVRIGSANASTVYVNSNPSGGSIFNSMMKSFMRVKEVKS